MSPNEALLRLLRGHLAVRRQVRIQDVYKLLYQGVFGAEHLLADRERASAFLLDEWDRTDADPNEPLAEPASVDGEIIRVNFARCRAEKIACDDVLQVFLNSCERIGNAELFVRLWQNFVELCRLKQMPYDQAEVVCYGDHAKAEGFPARHHSPEYRQANRPAYCVVKRTEFEALLAKMNRGDNEQT